MPTTTSHTSDEIFTALTEMAADILGIEASDVTRDSNLVEDFDADSLDLVELALQAKSAFGVEIPKERMIDMTTVGAVVDYVAGN